ncbi:MAG: glycoside hydrolase [Phycisphaera sp.]|nr:glycoside hydrolase [Phycisphaera sp.]
MRRSSTSSSCLALAATAAMFVPTSGSNAQEVIEAGSASWYASVPEGRAVPCDETGAAVVPVVTDDFIGHASTNDWCSSIFWKRQPGNDFGNPMFAMPLAFQASPDGLLLGRPPAPTYDTVAYSTRFGYDNAPIRITTGGLNTTAFAVAAAGDWTVTPRWSDGEQTLEATFGHGMPFVYARAEGGRPVVDPKSSLGFELIEIAGREACFRIAGEVYAAYASPGRTWVYDNGVFITDLLVEDGEFAVACLPDAEPSTRALFLAAADARISGSRVSWTYEEPTSDVVVDFEFVLEPGSKAAPVVALFRHQWLQAEIPVDEYLPGDFSTVRGDMKLAATSTFSVRHPFNGVLPHLPDLGQFDHADVASELDGVLSAPEVITGNNTYWNGKSLARAALLVPIAEQLGDDEARDTLISAMKIELEDWFRVGDRSGGTDGDDRFLAYESEWGTVLGYPDAFGSTSQLNDHHFHYGYLIMAAATIAQRDPAWADTWGHAVELLIRDVANWERSDARFPFLRNFDPYAGHAHASGHAAFGNGNNQESSSESINFATATILWGAAIGDDEIRDLGIFLHAVESKAIEQYWFDADEEVFPEDYPHSQLGILWSNGGDYATWWSANPEEIHGINLLPINTGSLHLGRHPTMMRQSYLHLLTTNNTSPSMWQDALWSGLAMGIPAAALAEFENNTYSPESGASRPHTRHWITSLGAWGRVHAAVSADTPHHAVFEKDGVLTRLAWNPGADPVTVTFSDGVSGCVAPGEIERIDDASMDCEPKAVPGDLDGDGIVGGADLGLMIGGWGDCDDGSDCPGDLDGDGSINGADLGLLFGYWSA